MEGGIVIPAIPVKRIEAAQHSMRERRHRRRMIVEEEEEEEEEVTEMRHGQQQQQQQQQQHPIQEPLALDRDNEMDDFTDDTNNVVIPVRTETRCSTCHQPGHARRSSRQCPFYAPGEKAPPRCSSCNLVGHKKNSPQCPNYIPMTLVARRDPFREDLVFGKDIDQGRHYMRPMVRCSKCGAFVWDEESVGGPKGDRKFTICCGGRHIQHTYERVHKV